MPEWFTDKDVLRFLNETIRPGRVPNWAPPPRGSWSGPIREEPYREKERNWWYPGYDRIEGRSRIELWHPEGGYQRGAKKPVGVGPQTEAAVRYAKLAGHGPERIAQGIWEADRLERDIERRALESIPEAINNLDTAKSVLRSKHAYHDRGVTEVAPLKIPYLDHPERLSLEEADCLAERASDEETLRWPLKFPQKLHEATELWRRERPPSDQRQFDFEMPEFDTTAASKSSAETKEVLGGWPEEPKKRPSGMTISSSDPKWPGPPGWTPDPLRKGDFHFRMNNDVSKSKPPAKTKNKMPNWAAWRELLKEDQLSGADIKRVDKMLSAHEKENWQRRAHDLGLHGLVGTSKAER